MKCVFLVLFSRTFGQMDREALAKLLICIVHLLQYYVLRFGEETLWE